MSAPERLTMRNSTAGTAAVAPAWAAAASTPTELGIEGRHTLRREHRDADRTENNRSTVKPSLSLRLPLLLNSPQQGQVLAERDSAGDERAG